MEDKPRITAEELAQNLAKSRKIMGKVDTGNYEKGAINEDIIKSDPEELMLRKDLPIKSSTKPVGELSPDKIRQSKLPDNIKKIMLEHPIERITLNDGLDMGIVDRAKKIMEEDGSMSNLSKQQTVKINGNDLEAKLAPIIENIIRKTLDEIVDKKLNQILTAHQTASLNENLVLKVGDSIFSGKITGVKNIK
jgi:hypothetical protein